MHPEGRRLEGLESIYKNKMSMQKTPMGGATNASSAMNARRTSEHKAFRPTMMQYEDDPAELVADTEMHGQKSLGAGGRGGARGGEAPLMMADRLDMI